MLIYQRVIIIIIIIFQNWELMGIRISDSFASPNPSGFSGKPELRRDVSARRSCQMQQGAQCWPYTLCETGKGDVWAGTPKSHSKKNVWSYLIGGLEHDWIIFHFIYMGCHPSHWRTHIFQDDYCMLLHHHPGIIRARPSHMLFWVITEILTFCHEAFAVGPLDSEVLASSTDQTASNEVGKSMCAVQGGDWKVCSFLAALNVFGIDIFGRDRVFQSVKNAIQIKLM